MSDTQTPNLGLPYIMPAQAQKHVTHNEAIRALDAVVQLAVLDRTLTQPPAAPANGARYIVAANAAGAWAGQAGRIASFSDGAWAMLAPNAGWSAWVGNESKTYVFDGAAWNPAQGGVDPAPKLGVNATADLVTRFAVAAQASLFTNDGAGHQQKINKAAAANTASQLYQTAYSGRAEIGLTGDDDLHFKVSADGAAWADALVLRAATGTPRLPSFTMAKLPLAALAGAGALVFVTDDPLGPLFAFSDGAAWLRVMNRAAVGYLPAAASPVFAPAAGAYSGNQAIALASQTPAAAFYYTTDGSPPTTASSLYAGPIPLTASTTVKAIAIASGFGPSAATSAAYVIAAAAPSAWDPNAHGALITLSNNNMDAAGSSGGWGCARGALGHATGGFYFEILEVAYTNDLGLIIGVSDGTSASAAMNVVNAPNSVIWRTDGYRAAVGNLFTLLSALTGSDATGVVWGVAVDASHGMVWISRNGVWCGGVAPVMGSKSGVAATFTAGPAIYPLGAVYGSTDKMRLLTGAAQLTYGPPAGFAAWG